MENQSSLITDYGLKWSRFDAHWGSGRGNKDDTEDNLSDGFDGRKFIGVYCLYKDGVPVYVGQAGVRTRKKKNSEERGEGSALYWRLKNHNRMLPEDWQHFSWFGVEKDKVSNEQRIFLLQLEAILINLINPSINSQSGSFQSAKHHAQKKHAKATGSKMDQLLKAVEDLRKA